MAFNDPFLRDLEDLSASDDHESDDDQFEDLDHNLNPDEFAEPHEQDYSRLKDDSSLLELLKSLDSETQNKLDAIKKTNDMLKKINPETQIVFKRCRDAYHKQFAELESIITNPFDYARVVKAIGNELKI
jgi:U4/U6 small nuclear ribonucleoprotein PRP31